MHVWPSGRPIAPTPKRVGSAHNRHATEAFHGDPRALDVVEDWTGTREELVAIVRELLRGGGER